MVLPIRVCFYTRCPQRLTGRPSPRSFPITSSGAVRRGVDERSIDDDRPRVSPAPGAFAFHAGGRGDRSSCGRSHPPFGVRSRRHARNAMPSAVSPHAPRSIRVAIEGIANARRSISSALGNSGDRIRRPFARWMVRLRRLLAQRGPRSLRPASSTRTPLPLHMSTVTVATPQLEIATPTISSCATSKTVFSARRVQPHWSTPVVATIRVPSPVDVIRSML